jgi:hypothetical protein
VAARFALATGYTSDRASGVRGKRQADFAGKTAGATQTTETDAHGAVLGTAGLTAKRG